MRRMVALVMVMLVGLLVAPLSAAAQGGSAVQSGVTWMQANQQPDGGFPGFGAGDTADAIQALVASGADLADFAPGGNTALAFLESAAADYAGTSVGAAAKLTMAAAAIDADPTNFGGVNLLKLIGDAYDASTGQYGADVYGHALALLAIRSVGATPPAAAVTRLADLQLADGGWSFDGTADSGSDTNTTSLVMQALRGLPQTSAMISDARDYLRSQQNDDGGFPYSQTSSFGNASDANSTAAAIQAIRAAGEDPQSAAWTRNGATPLDLLASLQNASGAFRYQEAMADDNALATYQAVPALLVQTLPVRVSTVAGAQALVAPGTAAAPALPATAGETAPLAMLLLLAVAALLGGWRLRRVA